MLSSWLVALSVAVSPGQCATCGPDGGTIIDGGMAFSPGMSADSWSAGMGGFGNPYDAVSMGGGGGGDQLYPFDSPEPWLWGHFQEIPAYGGYASFRPHNYKHVLAQMDVAGRWGISPTMAYSHQWYHRYRQRAGMHPNYGTPYAATGSGGSFGDMAAADSASGSGRFYEPGQADDSLIQAAAMERGYAGTPIPGISVPAYQLSEVPEGRDSLGDEYLSRLAQMQQHIDRQNYEMQVLRQQVQSASSAQAAAVPGQFPYASPAQAAAPAQAYHPGMNTYAQSGYQELPPPAAYQQPPQSMTQPGYIPAQPQQRFVQPNYQQPIPSPQPNSASATGYVPQGQFQPSASPAYAPQQFAPQQFAPQPSPPANGQPVYNGAASPYGVAPSASGYPATPQSNGQASGYSPQYPSGQADQFSVPQQTPRQPLIVPMGHPSQLPAQSYGAAPAQSTAYPGTSGGVVNAYSPQPAALPSNAASVYGTSGFAR